MPGMWSVSNLKCKYEKQRIFLFNACVSAEFRAVRDPLEVGIVHGAQELQHSAQRTACGNWLRMIHETTLFPPPGSSVDLLKCQTF